MSLTNLQRTNYQKFYRIVQNNNSTRKIALKGKRTALLNTDCGEKNKCVCNEKLQKLYKLRNT